MDMTFNLGNDKDEKAISGLNAMLLLAQRVKHLDVIFSSDVNHMPPVPMQKFMADVQALNNLSPLHFGSISRGYWNDRTPGHIPHHSKLTFSSTFPSRICQSLGWIGRFLEIQKNTLNSVPSFDIAVKERASEVPRKQRHVKPEWTRLLEAAESLRDEATVEISRPRVLYHVEDEPLKFLFVSFAPFQENEDTATNAESSPVSVITGTKNGFEGIHYLTKAGNLQIGLKYMMENYAELLSAKIWLHLALSDPSSNRSV